MTIPISNSLIEACAHAAHEANRAYCIATGDNTQLPWNQAPEWQRDSSRAGLVYALEGVSPEEQHAAWCRTKVEAVWTYGPAKDPEKLTHPCLVPYADLPEVQKRKDEIYGAVVRAVARGLGYPVIDP